MLESRFPMPSAGSVARTSIHSRPIKRSLSDGDLFSFSNKKAKHQEDDSAPVNPIRCSTCQGIFFSWSKKDKQQDAEDLCGSESAMVNLPIMRSSISDKHQDPSLSLPLPAKTSVKNIAAPPVFNICLDAKPDPKDPCGSESAKVSPPFMRSSIAEKHQDISLKFSATLLSSFNDMPMPDPKATLDYAWGMLNPAIRFIFLDEPYNFSYPEISNAVRLAWRYKSGETLFKLILKECRTFVAEAIQSLEGQCNDAPSVFLPLVVKCSLHFRTKFEFLCNLAGGYESRIVDGSTLWKLCVELFPTHLCLATEVRDMVLSNILAMIRDQRSGKYVDTTQLYELMVIFSGDAFHTLSFFEKPFLECAAEFYAAEAMQVLEQSDLPQYLKYVERRLGEEKEKCRSFYFFAKFRGKLMEVVERELLGARATAILEKGFDQFMDERRVDDLARMYTLFTEANLVGHLNSALSSYIMKTGRKILAEGSSLADFKDSVDRICISDFNEDELLDKTFEQCFKDLGLPWKERGALVDSKHARWLVG